MSLSPLNFLGLVAQQRTPQDKPAGGHAIAITRYLCSVCNADYENEVDAKECFGAEEEAGDKRCPVCASKCDDTRDAADCCLWKDIDAPTRWRMADAVDDGSTWAEQLAAYTGKPAQGRA